METTIIQIVLGLLLFIVPVYFIQAYQLRFLNKTASAVAMLIVKYAVLGIMLYFIVRWDNLWLDALFAVLMVAFASLSATIRAKLGLRRHFLPVVIGVAVAALIVGAYLMLFFHVGGSETYSQHILPIVGVLCGGMVEVDAKALTFYYMGLRNHQQMYYYLLGNGATRSSALFYFRKRAMERTVLHYLKVMSAVVVASASFVLWAMLLCKADVVQAVLTQVAFLGGAFCASVLSVAITLNVATRYAMDEYGRIE